MPQLSTFISKSYRPEVIGGKLDAEHKTQFNLSPDDFKKDLEVMDINAICFGPKKDRVLLNLEYALDSKDNIFVFYFEDIHRRWEYVSSKEENYFIYKKNNQITKILKPRKLYIRGCYIEPHDAMWRILGNFFNYVDMWKGEVLCAPKKQITNESKLYQLNNSLSKCAKKYPSISIGQSYVIKGHSTFQFLNKNDDYIVKSLSGVRSIVVDKSHFSKWPQKNIRHLPVLFQKKVTGNDIRIHIIANNIYAKQTHGKQNIDYRYDKAFFSMSDLLHVDEDLVSFSQDVTVEEKNELLGIDYIQDNNKYIVLEANPSPGWSAYYECNGIDNPSFVNKLIRVLTSENNE